MNKTIKRFLTGLVSVVGFSALIASGQINSASPSPALNYSTNVVTATQVNVVAITNSCKVAQIILVAGSNATNGFVVNFYDSNTTNTTYTNAAYTNRVEFVTNWVTQWNGLAGITNFFTNSQFFETNVLEPAATNNLPYQTFIAPSGNIATYNVNMLQVNGLMFTATTNGTVIVRYRVND